MKQSKLVYLFKNFQSNARFTNINDTNHHIHFAKYFTYVIAFASYNNHMEGSIFITVLHTKPPGKKI